MALKNFHKDKEPSPSSSPSAPKQIAAPVKDLTEIEEDGSSSDEQSDELEDARDHETELWSRGTKTLLIGPPGSGKTTALSTFIEAGLDLFVVGTDPGFEESILDAVDRKGLDRKKLHYHYIGPASAPWTALMAAARQVNMLGYEALSSLKTGINKQEYTQFLELLSTLANFKDDQTGKSWGPVDDFPTDCALAIDSLSGVNIMAMDMMIGGKPTAHQGEWGVAMNMEEKLLLKLTSDLKCFFVLTAHVENEPDMLSGVPQKMVGALGRKLAPKIPRTFSDVILSVKEGDKFSWSTAATGVDLKTRALPIRDKLDPDFRQIVEVWRRRNQMK